MPTLGAYYGDKEIVYAGCEPKAIPVTILSGQNLPKGAALGRQTSSGKYVGYDDGGTDDGRRVAAGILVAAVDATAGDVVASMYIGDGQLQVANLLPASAAPGFLDAAGIADLNGRVIDRGSADILIF